MSERMDQPALLAENATEKQKSLLSSFVDQAQALVWQPENAAQSQIRDEVSHYASSFAKTGFLFVGGRWGRVGTVALFGLDQAKVSDDLGTQTLDFTLGGVKGMATRGIFKATGSAGFDAPTRGIALGIGSRFVDGMTNRENYQSVNGGADGLSNAIKFSMAQTFNGRAMVTDALIFGTAHSLTNRMGLLKGATSTSDQIIKSATVGAVYGTSSGAVGELHRQSAMGEDFDLSKVLLRGALQGTVDAGAAAAAGRFNIHLARQSELRNAIPRERSSISQTEISTSTIPGIEKLNLAPRYPSNYPGLREILSNPSVETVTVKGQPSEVLRTNPPTDYLKFRAALPNETQTMHVYRPKGMPEVAIEAAHDAQLNQVRVLRQTIEQARASGTVEANAQAKQAQATLDAHPLRNALLPEELLPIMAQLPELGMTKRIVITTKPNAEDAFYARKHDMPQFRSEAEVTKDGVMTLFQPSRTVLDFTVESPTRGKLMHEWTHLLRWQLGDKASLYDKATALEHDARGTDYSRTSPSEDMARNLTDLLHGDARRMVTTSQANPLRSSILARQLRETLTETPTDQRSKYHQQYLDRAKAVEEMTAPAAQRTLIEQIRQNPGSQAHAARLLLEMGWGDRLADIGPVARLDLSRSMVTDAHLAKIDTSALTHLDISGAVQLTPAATKTIGTMTGLVRLDAPYTKLAADLLRVMEKMPNLTHADLRFTDVQIKNIKAWKTSNPQVEVVY